MTNKTQAEDAPLTLFPAHARNDDVRPEAYAYYFRQWREFNMPFHQHDCTEIMYVIRGSCRVEVRRDRTAGSAPDAGGSDAVELSNGEFIVVGANVPHRLVVEGACRMLNVEFGFLPADPGMPMLRELVREEPTLAAFLASGEQYTVLRDPDIVYYALKSLVLELDARSERQERENGLIVHLMFVQLLVHIARLWQAAAAESQPAAGLYVRKCIEYMRQYYDRDIRAKDIAAAVNLHPGYVHRIFKAQTGKTLVDYLTELRMEKAKMLLARTDIPIADISEYVGVGSRQYFHALFKRHTNQTPAQYRQSATAQRTVHARIYAGQRDEDSP